MNKKITPLTPLTPLNLRGGLWKTPFSFLLKKAGEAIHKFPLKLRGIKGVRNRGIFGVLILFLFLLPNVSEAATITAAVATSTDANAWSAGTTWIGGVAPTSADDVLVPLNSVNLILNTNSSVNSLDMTGYTGTLIHNAAITLTIAGGSGSVFKLASGMTYTLGNGATSALSFTGTTATTTITTAGKTVGNITFNGTGGWQLLDTLTATGGSVRLDTGSFDTNNQTITAAIFKADANNTRVLTLGSSSITLSSYFVARQSNITITTNTATITQIGASSSFTSYDTINYQGLSVVLSGSGTATFNHGTNNGSVTLANLTRTGTAAKTDGLSTNASITITNTFTVNGASSTSRVLVTSDTLGTARTITAANVSISNADFRDITGAGAATWDLSTATGGSGNAGGNSMKALGDAAFTTATTTWWIQGASPAARNWSDATNWNWANGTATSTVGSRVPLPQDDVRFDASSFTTTGKTVTLDMPRAGKNIDWTGATYSPTWTLGNDFTLYGSLTLISGMTFNGAYAVTFEGRAAGMPVGGWTLTSAGKSFYYVIYLSMFGGTLTLQDALYSSNWFILNNGTFNANNFNVTSFVFSSNNNNVRTVNMGSGTWTVNSGDATPWNIGGSNLTLNAQTSTVAMISTAATAKTFAGAGKTYNNVTFSGDNITVTGSNIFNNFAVNNAGRPNGLILTAGTTQTINGNFTTNASLGRIAKLTTTSTGTGLSIITRASGMFCGEYMNISSSTVQTTGTATYYAANSTNSGNNSGWLFSQCPAPNTGARGAGATSGTANEEVRGGLKIRGGVKFR